jgi:hypothetical protein
MSIARGSIAEKVVAPPLPETIVNIAVERVGRGWRLRYFPQRPGDTVVFHTSPTRPRTPERPRTVRWNAYGLAKNQKLVIQEKGKATRYFSSNRFEIEPGSTTIESGEALTGPSLGSDLNWYYSIILSADGTELAKIDPVVIIKDDT